jgi:hypothetical protein
LILDEFRMLGVDSKAARHLFRLVSELERFIVTL